MIRLVLPATLAAAPAFADPEGYTHMMDHGYGYGVGAMFGPVLWIVVLGLVVAGVIWLVRRTDPAGGAHSSANALATLDMRFARGEIDAEEYAARKKLLTG